MKYYNIYRSSPVFMQNIMCSLYGYRESKKRFNKTFKEYLDTLKGTEYFSEISIERYKKDKLTQTLLVAKNHPLYKDKLYIYESRYIEQNPYKVLEELPILSKEDIINFDMRQVASKNSQIYQTSGTTGKALSLCKDDDSIAMQWAIWLRHRERFGIKLNDLSVNFVGKPIVPDSQKSPPFWRFNAANNQYLVSSRHITNENIESIVEFLNSIKPKFYSGYPSIIYEVSRIALQNNLKLNTESSPDVVFCGAENLLDYQKDAISNWTSSIITDQYGLTEGNCNFSKCEFGNYHEDFEFCHIELENEETLPDGSIKGNLLGTAFFNKALPLIRYRTGDVAIFAPESFKCPCGRNSRVIKEVQGRQDDYVITPDGRHVMRFDYLFKDTYEALEVQTLQENLGEVVFKAVLLENADKQSFEEKVRNHFYDYIAKDMKIVFRYVDHIEKSSTGKFKAVLNKVI